MTIVIKRVEREHRLGVDDAVLGDVDGVRGVELLREEDAGHRRTAAGDPVGARVLDHPRDEADLVLAFVEVGCWCACHLLSPDVADLQNPRDLCVEHGRLLEVAHVASARNHHQPRAGNTIAHRVRCAEGRSLVLVAPDQQCRYINCR